MHPSAHPTPDQPDTVLVIDNDPICVEWLSRKLKREGLAIVAASSGVEGLQMARDLRPLAIFLDVVMPEMDGWEVVKELKSSPELASIPVILVSMLDERNRARALGVFDYLVKPVDGNRLSALVKQLRHTHQPGFALIVEDDPTNREMLARLLGRQGWDVVTAENGLVALERVHERMPDVIILDLMLPKMDGQMFTEELRKVPAYRSIPIVVLTSKDLGEKDRRSLGGSVRKVLQKGSCNRDELLRAIRSL